MTRDRRHPDRRTVLAAAAALGGAAAAPGLVAAAPDFGGAPSLTLFDPTEPVARAFARTQGGERAAIEGDRIRLARRLLCLGAPSSLRVIGRHADLLLLAEAAREAGYRPLTLDRLPAADGHGTLFVWTARRRI